MVNRGGLSVALFLLSWIPAAAQGAPLADVSGAVRLSDGRYLTIHDHKGELSEQLRSQIRAALVDLTPAPGKPLPQVRPLAVVWPGPPATDLEGICPVPGHPDYFLATESGYVAPFRRVFLLHWSAAEESLSVRGGFPLPELDEEVEGIACLGLADGTLRVFLGGRQSPDGGPGSLYWGTWKFGADQVAWSESGLVGQELHSSAPVGIEWRSCSDLWLDENNRLWVSEARDAGDQGPFDSLIYSPGILGEDPDQPLRPDPWPHTYFIHGYKVESLCGSGIPGRLLFGTDDEDFGGTLRYLDYDLPVAP